jgi:predicted nucleic acid-binding protein
MEPKHIYLDVCTLCRPFDDQAQMRVRLETEATQMVLSHVRSGSLKLFVSPAHTVEIEAIRDFTEREYLLALLQEIGQEIVFDSGKVRQRAETLLSQGLGPADAVHVAFAEAIGASFITCDDRLLRQCNKIQPNIWCGNPVAFCEKENLR